MQFSQCFDDFSESEDDSFIFIVKENDLLLYNNEIPKKSEFKDFLSPKGTVFLGKGLSFGRLDGRLCFVFSMKEDDVSSVFAEGILPDVFAFISVREIFLNRDSDLSKAAAIALHFTFWNNHSRFCGSCGARNIWENTLTAKKCPECGYVQFPKISPAIIIAVSKGDELLLAHNANFPEGRYSVLAGFMEMGESIEETAAREVREEVGIDIKNIQYYSSQSWPFPDSLMIGLTAEYDSGEIVSDGIEILHADWYSPDNFPDIPGHGTIARKLIEYTKRKNKS
ncbi:MAG: NAD(+) diphosphatase [Spirochaetales bacterium]|nr:NAD(+) diphosphatase [Spirochaetales bacterium]